MLCAKFHRNSTYSLYFTVYISTSILKGFLFVKKSLLSETIFENGGQKEDRHRNVGIQ